MKNKYFKKLICALFVTCLAFSGTSAEARGKKMTLKQMKADIFQKLNKLEGKHPPEQAEIFKIKAAVDALCRRVATTVAKSDKSNKLVIPPLPEGYDFYARCKGLTDGALRRQLVGTMVNQLYQRAQDTVFILLDNMDSEVKCVYTGRVIKTETEPSPNDMNIEHTWPQSQGAVSWAKVDLHHLFPSDSKANGIRSNLPFGNVEHPTWTKGGSSCDGDSFQVRKEQRGDTARAKFYFSVMYNKKIPSGEEKVLRKWHRNDPPSAYEKKRNEYIFKLQHNRNPFVDKPEFVEKIKDF